MGDSTTPRLLVSTESLLGTAPLTRARTLGVQERYRDPAAVARSLTRALDDGADGVLMSPSAALRAAIASMPRRPPAYALLPNVPQYVRDSSDRGVVGTALARLRGVPPGALLRVGLTGMSHVLRVLQGDFAGLVPVLLELEHAALADPAVRAVVLAAPLTDLALAGRHREFFAHYVRFVRRRFRARAAFATDNLGHLLGHLAAWNVRPDFVIGPVNPLGFMMKPAPAEVLRALASTTIPVLAKNTRAGGAVSLADGVRYAREHGASGIVADLAELEGDPAG